MLGTDVGKQVYKSVSAEGIDHSNPAMKLYHKAKKLGVWNPLDIDFTKDKEDWKKLTQIEQEYIVSLVAQFNAGEECVTMEILPLMATMAAEGRLEDEMYLTTFAFEEAKHTEFFRRFLDEVACVHGVDLSEAFQPAYRKVIYEELPKAMQALWTDQSLEAQMNASVTYNMMIEGVIAETGYHNFYNILDKEGILPGLREGVALIQRDESRHIGYGVYLISRLVAEDPTLLPKVQSRMQELMGMTEELLEEGAREYDHMEVRPFDLARNESQEYAATRFMGRMNVIARSTGKSEAELKEVDYEYAGSLEGSAD